MSKRQHRGFTLFELMLTIGIAALVLGLGVPNLRQFMLNNRMTANVNDMLIAIHTARTEAIKRHVQTVMCFTSDPEADEPECDGDGSDGWIVFVDDADPTAVAAEDNNGVVDEDEEVVLRHLALPEGITPNSAPADNAGYVAFNAAGFSRAIALGSPITSVVLCDKRGNQAIGGAANSAARALQVAATGRPAVTRAVAQIEGLGGCP